MYILSIVTVGCSILSLVKLMYKTLFAPNSRQGIVPLNHEEALGALIHVIRLLLGYILVQETPIVVCSVLFI